MDANEAQRDPEPPASTQPHDRPHDAVPEYPPLPTPQDTDAYLGTRALRTPPRSDVNLDVPYVHQLWDTPAGFNGHWACGPSCAAMVLAHYGLLPPKRIELSEPLPHVSDYGWYVGSIFTHGATTFDAEAATPTGSAAGLYGAVVDRIGSGWGAHWRSGRDRGIRPLMDAFLPPKGNSVRFADGPKRSGTIFMQRAAAERTMQACLDDGHPLIVSGRFAFRGKVYDHLVVVRGYYRDATSGDLHWIVNDPYGFETTGAGFDGANVAYEFDEIDPKWMCVFSGPHRAARNDAPPAGHVPVRLFDARSNQQVGEGTLIDGTDKVYIRRLDKES